MSSCSIPKALIPEPHPHPSAEPNTPPPKLILRSSMADDKSTTSAILLTLTAALQGPTNTQQNQHHFDSPVSSSK